MNAHDIELALRARATFNDSVERIDADTRRRLRDLRLHAVDVAPARAGARWMWPAGAALTAALALAVFLPHVPRAPSSATPAVPVVVAASGRVAPASPVSDGNAVVAVQPATADTTDAATLETTDPDMLHDLDFYGWLAKQPANGNTGG